MNEARKQALLRWLPPAVVDAMLALRGVSFSRARDSWAEAARASAGYDSASILESTLAASRAVRDGTAAYERDSVLFDHIEYSFPVLATLLRAACENGGRLSVLDFGGALGGSYRECRPFIGGAVRELRWSVVEQSTFVEAGRHEMQTRELGFFDSMQAAHQAHACDVVLFSAVLQYLESPHARLDEAMSLAPRYIVIDRTIIGPADANRPYVQHVGAKIYAASYPVWVLSQPRLLAQMAGSYELVSMHASLPFPALRSIGAEFKGFIFESKTPR